MLSVIVEESDEIFSLLIRIEKADLKDIQSQSAYIEVRHIQNQPGSKISPKKQTNPSSVNSAVWMQDIDFENVSSSDEFIFTLLNDSYLAIAQHKMQIRRLMPFLNIGELVQQKITLRSKTEAIADLTVSFSLFQPKEPLAGVYPLELSLNPTNQNWKTQQKNSSTSSSLSPNFLCSCLDKDIIQGFPEVQNIQRTPRHVIK